MAKEPKLRPSFTTFLEYLALLLDETIKGNVPSAKPFAIYQDWESTETSGNLEGRKAAVHCT